MLINVRGAFGAGKSTVVKSLIGNSAELVLLAEANAKSPTKANPERMVVKTLVGRRANGVIALGNYQSNCGGCDEWSWAGAHDAICDAIIQSLSEAPVSVFEGVTIAGIYQRYVDLAGKIYKEFGRRTHVVYVMPTAEECLRRVSLRSGRPVTDRMTSSVFDKWRAVNRTYERLLLEAPPGIVTHYFSGTDEARDAVHNLVKQGGGANG